MSDDYKSQELQCPKCKGSTFIPAGLDMMVICTNCKEVYSFPPVVPLKYGSTVYGLAPIYTPGINADKIIGLSDADFVEIPSGSFIMGSPEDEEMRSDNEQQHEVTVKSFYMLKTPVTVRQYDFYRRANGIEMPESNNPETQLLPVQVNFLDALQYVDWLSKATGEECRLPTEAEFEYACRAGTTTAFWTGDTITMEQANFSESFSYGGGPGKECRLQVTPVNYLPPNPWGLYDINANGPEFCDSIFVDGYNGQEVRQASKQQIDLKLAIKERDNNAKIAEINGALIDYEVEKIRNKNPTKTISYNKIYEKIELQEYTHQYTDLTVALKGTSFWFYKGDARSAARKGVSCCGVDVGFRVVKSK